MINHFCQTPLWEVGRRLTAVATGREPAELVICNARLINVCTGEIQPGMDVAVVQGRIALVGAIPPGCIGPDTRVIQAEGGLIAPGFLDGHIHIESSMLSVGEYARVVIPHGTIGVYTDPHEICNVFGVAGVRLMIEDSRRTPLKAMFTAPSCVPAVPGFEDAGASIGPEDIREMMAWDEVVGLGEMMNYPAVVAGAAQPHDEMAEALKADKVITGHWAARETGAELNAYIAAGARCCHESTQAEDALAKMRLGMYAQLREGSAWRDLHEVAKAITEHKVDARFANLVSDDVHPNTLISQGHLDHLLRRAVKEGINPLTAIQMVTINCATCFRMDHELGSITPGKCADIVFLEDLKDFHVTRTIIDGVVVAENGELLCDIPEMTYPKWATNSLHVGETITAETFRILAPAESGKTVSARIIEIIPAQVGNVEQITRLPVRAGSVLPDPDQDVLKCFVFERHKATGSHGMGFVKGFGIRRGALAQTVAHDAHNLIVVGANDDDMALAANTLLQCGGGLCAVLDGTLLGLVPLPVAGLMSDSQAEEVAVRVEALEQSWKTLGCTCESPFMTMASLSLACIPELRLTNKGLVDCRCFEMRDLFVTGSC